MPHKPPTSRIYERELGAVEVHRYKNAKGEKDDYVLLPARILQEVGIDIWEDTSQDPPVVHIRSGAPKALQDIEIRPNEIPSPLDGLEPIKDAKCPTCQETELFYHEDRNRYDCRNCHASFDFGGLMAQWAMRKIKTPYPNVSWKIINPILSVAKAPSSKGGEVLLATDGKGNFIGISTDERASKTRRH